MKIYRRKKSGTIVLWLLVAALYAAAIFTLADLARDGIKNYTAFFILIPLFLFVPLVLTFFLVGFSRTYFVFEKDFFEYHTWRDSIVIPAKNLRFFTFDSGILTVYFVRENPVSVSKFIHAEKTVRKKSVETHLAVKTDGELFKLAVPSIGLYEHGERILAWFYENLPAYVDGQMYKDLDEIEKKYTGIEPDAVKTLLTKARRLSKIFNLIGIVLGLSIVFFREPYHLMVSLCLLYPIFFLFILHYSDGWIRFDRRGNSIYPTACLAVIGPAIGLGYRMLALYNFADWKRLLLFSALFYVAYLALFIALQKEYSFKDAYTYGALAAFSVFFFMYAFAGTAAINCAFDYSAPTATVIIKNKEPVPVQMHNGLLGIKWYYSVNK